MMKFVICVVGKSLDFDELKDLAPEITAGAFVLDGEFSVATHDADMLEAFAVSAHSSRPSMAGSDLEIVRSHDSVAYFVADFTASTTALSVAGWASSLVAYLFSNYKIAAKCESSGVAHGRERWLELLSNLPSEGAETRARNLYHCWVKRPLLDRGDFYSCGLHLLGYPDVQVNSGTPAGATAWIDELAAHMLLDNQILTDGQTFSLDSATLPLTLNRVPCDRYDEDDLFYNENGYWVLTRNQ